MRYEAVRLQSKSPFLECILMITCLLITSPRCVYAQASPRQNPSISIVPPATEGEVTKFAIQDLARYLHEMTGETITVGKAAAKHRIFVGELPSGLDPAAAGKLRGDLANVEEDGFVLRSIGPDVVILGKGPRGNLYGSYAYLERLGVRWYFPGKQYEIVPHRALNWSIPLNDSESPAFRQRILFYWPNNYTAVTDWIDFAAKVRLNRIAFHYTWPARDWYINLRPELLPELKKRGVEIEVAGHFLSSFLPRTLYPERPDWFRMNNAGQRVADFNFNPFNSDALEYLAGGAVKYLLQMPEASLFHLWPDDIEGGGWSHEPGKSEYTASDQSLLVANYLIGQLRQKLPNAHLAFLAYHDTVYPPKVVKPDPGVIFFYAPRERCYAHALDDAECPLNRKYSQALERALPMFGGANAEVFEYYVDEILYENVTNPPLPEVLAADARYYHKLGIPAVGALMTNTSNFLSPMANMFLYPQALWDPQRDLNQSLNDYAAVYFGDPRVAEYLHALSSGLEDVLKICQYEHPGSAWDNLRVDVETDDALAYHVRGLEEGIRGPLRRASELLGAALLRARNKTFRERLASEQASMQFTILQAKLYHHLLKGEQFYRIWKKSHDGGAGLGTLAESVLARRTWEEQQKFVARSSMKGHPLIPAPRPLEERASELIQAINRDPKSVSGVSIWGYSIDPLEEQLKDGIGGCIVAGPTGSRAMLWTDSARSGKSLRSGGQGLVWEDEFGQPLETQLDLFAAPAVVDAPGIPADKLFDALVAAGQRK